MAAPTSRSWARTTWTLLAAAAIAAALSACGSSSKPAYCAQSANLKKSVQELGSVNVLQGGTSGLSSQLQKVESNARALASSAKSDFPSQVEAINSSVDAIKKTGQQLAASPAQPALIAKLPGQISAVASSVQEFTNATSSKCK